MSKRYTPGSPEWHDRVQTLLKEESTQPERWWYLSFVDPSKPVGQQFLGACVVQAGGAVTAMQEARKQGCNPGGEIMYFELGDTQLSLPVNKLLSKEELGPGFKTVGELEHEDTQ